MKNIILAISIIIFSNFSLGAEIQTPRIFIMIDIDNVILDTILPIKQQPNTPYIDTLKQSGFSVQTLPTNSIHSNDPKLDSYLKKTGQKSIDLNDSNRKKLDETIVIRPWIKYLLEELTKFEIPTYILICSKASNARTHSIITNLDLDINKIPFKDAVQFVPKEFFTVYINSFNSLNSSNKIIAKSAFELRNRYSEKFGKILPTDYVLLIDKLSDSQFILYDREHDLNIKISPFVIKPGNNYNSDYDQIEMKITLDKIKKFVNKS